MRTLRDYAHARAEAKPDKGWDYDLCAEPTEGVRRAIENKGGKTDPALFSADSFEECLVQAYARMTYPSLLRLLGAEPAHADAALLNGYAYGRGTRNLIELMRACGFSGETLAQALRSEDPRDSMKRKIAQVLGISIKKAGWLLTQAGTKRLDDFRAKMAQVQAHAPPQGTA